MARATIVFGGILVLVGVVAYTATSFASVTALIPAFMGALMLGLGLLARARPGTARGAIIGAAVVAVLAILGSTRGIAPFLALLRGEEIVRPIAAVAQTVTLVLSAAYLVVLARLRAGRTDPAA